jgi:hypothetical protein
MAFAQLDRTRAGHDDVLADESERPIAVRERELLLRRSRLESREAARFAAFAAPEERLRCQVKSVQYGVFALAIHCRQSRIQPKGRLAQRAVSSACCCFPSPILGGSDTRPGALATQRYKAAG